MRKMVLIGAYGRAYRTRTDAARDWAQGKDFMIMNGPYCSIRDLETMRSYGMPIEIHISHGEPLVVYDGARDPLAGII
jgi:hypothetical protein